MIDQAVLLATDLSLEELERIFSEKFGDNILRSFPSQEEFNFLFSSERALRAVDESAEDKAKPLPQARLG